MMHSEEDRLLIGKFMELPMLSKAPQGHWIWNDEELQDWVGLPMYYDWNELMPVYRKIRDWLGNMERPNKDAVCKLDAMEIDIHCAVTEVEIEKAFDSIVEWIKFKNDKYGSTENLGNS